MKSNLLGAHGQLVDGESLQADVMRFMAIIAFCLVAILALVRNVEPAPGAPQQAPAASKESAANKAPAAGNQSAANREPAANKAPAPVPEKVVRVKPAAPAARPVTAPVQPKAPTEVAKLVPQLAAPAALQQKPAALQQKPAALQQEPAPSPIAPATSAQDPAASSKQSASPERGLSLRFASDRDFMRLVTKGDIQVYAFQHGAQVLGLARNFEFNQAPAPGRLYELLPDTIPGLVVSALHRATDDAAAFTWGIRLPPELEGRIRRYVDQDAVGELVIDRFGRVHHVAG